jgi:hypothetical protein
MIPKVSLRRDRSIVLNKGKIMINVYNNHNLFENLRELDYLLDDFADRINSKKLDRFNFNRLDYDQLEKIVEKYSKIRNIKKVRK